MGEQREVVTPGRGSNKGRCWTVKIILIGVFAAVMGAEKGGRNVVGTCACDCLDGCNLTARLDCATSSIHGSSNT